MRRIFRLFWLGLASIACSETHYVAKDNPATETNRVELFRLQLSLP